MKFLCRSTLRLLLPLLLLVAGTALAANPPAPAESKSWQEYSQSLDQSAKRLDVKPASIEALEQATIEALAASQFAQTCISQYDEELTKAQTSLDSLGEQNALEDSDLKKTRADLQKQKTRIEKNLSQCRLLSVRAKDIQDQASLSKQDILKERLLAPGESAFNLLMTSLQQPSLLTAESETFFWILGHLPVHAHNIRTALTYGLLGLLTGFAWSIYRRQQHVQEQQQLSATSPTLAALWGSLSTVMPWILAFGLINLSFHFSPPGVEALAELARYLLIFSVSYAILSSTLRPNTSMSGINPVFPATSRKLFFWARLFLFAILLEAVLYSPLLDTDPPSSLIGLIRIGLGTASSLALIRLIWVLRKHLPWIRRFRLQLVVGLVILTAIVMLWLGYQNFSLFLFSSTFGSLFVLLVSWFLFRIPTEVFDGMDEGRAEWQKNLRTRLGLEAEKIVPGLIWARLTHVVLLFFGTGLVLLRLWGMSEQTMQVMLTQLLNGFQIGKFTLEPMRIIGGLLLLALLISLNHLIKNSLANNWLQRTNLSRGAREAIVTITGYVGILMSILIGLSVAGIEFTNLAIIAGALSVGIGFGLQNIVNNFVSGLILLFERPIRRGDWIRVGTSEGYVRDISIRSTVIQTFDRSDIIVPNSELISNQVTNMMLTNQYGRIVIPVGVAHGSDTELVMKTLYRVAEKHPAILREQGELKLDVFFRSFGESALHFELRCQIRDVENKLLVTSELNLAIDKAFRENNIRMPFPQRTLHFANVPQEMYQKPAKSDDLG